MMSLDNDMDDDGALIAAENGTVFTQTTSDHPLQLDEAHVVASVPSSSRNNNDDDDDDDSVMEGYSTQEEIIEELRVETCPNAHVTTTIGMNGVTATVPLGDYDAADSTLDNNRNSTLSQQRSTAEGQVDLEVGLPPFNNSNDDDNDEYNNHDGSANTDSINTTDAHQDAPMEEQTITCRMRTWQYTRFILHIALFPILVITSVAIPIVIVMFCFALMFVAMVVLLCVYYCCSPQRGDQAAVPFHVLIRQILEAVEDETNGLGDPFADTPKLSREEIQNSLVRRKLIHFECTDENDNVVGDPENMDEATREERMHQDMFPVMPEPAILTNPVPAAATEEESKNDNESKPTSDSDGALRGIRRRWSSRKRRRKRSQKNVEVLDHNSTYDLRLSQQSLTFKTDPKINNSKLFLLTRTFVFSPPLAPQKLDATRSANSNGNNSYVNSEDEDDEDANNTQRPANSGQYTLAAAAMEVDDDSSTSGFFPVMELPSSSSSSSISSSESSSEDDATAQVASSSDESFLLDESNDDGGVNPQLLTVASAGSKDPKKNVPPSEECPLRLSDSSSISETLSSQLIIDDTKTDKGLEADLDVTLGLEVVKAKASGPTDPSTEGALKSNVSQSSATLSTAHEQEFKVQDDVDLVEYGEIRGKEESDGGISLDTRQLRDMDDLGPDVQPTHYVNTGIAMSKTIKHPLMEGSPKELSSSDFEPVEEAKTEITFDESIVDTVPQPPKDNASRDDEAPTILPTSSPALPTNKDATTAPQPSTQSNEQRGISSYCNICLLEYEVGDIVVWSRRPHGCHHAWHEECLIDWLQRKPTCPSCRQEYFVAADAQQPTEQAAIRGSNSLEEENHNIMPESTHSTLIDSAHSTRFFW